MHFPAAADRVSHVLLFEALLQEKVAPADGGQSVITAEELGAQILIDKT